MNEDDKAHYEERKKKCGETKGLTKRELAEAQAKIIEEKPGYRLITRGPNKGKLRWAGYKQQRIDRSSIAQAKRRRAEDARKLLDPPSVTMPLPKSGGPKTRELSPEITWAYVFVFSVSIVSFLIAKLFAYFGVVGLAVLIDALCYLVRAKKTRQSRYLPFLWWFL
jgi:hypothetical protein